MTKKNTGKKDFTTSVHKIVGKIPRGKVMSYGAVARRAGFPGAARAVGNVMSVNTPDHIDVVPCHRVVCANGDIGGYAWGIRQKIAILGREGVIVENNKVKKEFLIS